MVLHSKVEIIGCLFLKFFLTIKRKEKIKKIDRTTKVNLATIENAEKKFEKKK